MSDETFFDEPTEQVAVPAQALSPYDTSIITVTLKLLPADGQPGGRPVLLGVMHELDVILIETYRQDELGHLPTLVQNQLAKLKARLEARDKPAPASTTTVTVAPVVKAAPAKPTTKPASKQVSLFDL